MAGETHEKIETLIREVLRSEDLDNVVVEFPEYDASGGFLSNMYFAHVTGETKGKVKVFNLIIKTNRKELTESEICEPYIYQNEVNFYETIVPIMRNFAMKKGVDLFPSIPHTYGTFSKNGEQIIIMKNLKLNGYRCHQIEKTLDLDHIRLVLKAYANWAALNLALADQNPEEFQKVKCNELHSVDLITKVASCFRKSVQDVLETYKERGSTGMVEKLQKFSDEIEDKMKECLLVKDLGQFQIIRHGDSWNNNFLFHYDELTSKPSDMVLIDFQCSTLGPPLADVSVFLFMCCSRAELSHLDELLKFYYNILSKKLLELGSDPTKVFPWEVCMNSFNKYAPVGVSGMAGAMRMRYQEQVAKALDIEKVQNDRDFSSMVNGALRDPEGYFHEVNAIYELCVERGFI